MKRSGFLNPFKNADKDIPLKVAFIITGIYIVLGVCWIIFSDRLLILWVSEKEIYAFISSIKGVVYVFASALLIFLMVFNAVKIINKANSIMKTNYTELENTNKKLAVSEGFGKAIISKMLNAYALHRII
ncbi:MAG: hypothetical protein GX625_06515, partial [Clostridiaceae bacterium]|nr:hypothetical protein [Clostridiaceae bacterium]